jgi:hypothetical protein
MPNALQARHVKRGRGMAEIMTMNGSPLMIERQLDSHLVGPSV